MLRKFFCSLGLAVLLACSVSVAAKPANDSNLLSGFDDYNYQTVTPQGHLSGALSIVLGTAANNGLSNYITDITAIESASCTNEAKMKAFLKKCRKTIKKAKLPKVSNYKEEEVDITYYAKEGMIISITNIDNDLSTIVVITGTKN